MGLIDRLLQPPHRYAAMQLRDYIVSKSITAKETQLIQSLGVTQFDFLTARQYLLAGIVQAAVDFVHRDRGNTGIRAAHSFLLGLLDDHFCKRPGVDAKQARVLLLGAYGTFGDADAEKLTPKFLEQIRKGAGTGVGSPALLSALAEIVRAYVTHAVAIVERYVVPL